MKVKKRNNLLVTTILSGVMFVLLTSTVYAKYYSYGYDLYSMTYKVKSSGADHIYETAAKNWRTSSGTNITESSTSANTVWTGNYGYGWYGLYSPTTSGGKTRFFSIKLDLRNLSDRFKGDFNKAAISTATHEFGHAQFLHDYKNSRKYTSIMSHQRIRPTMTKPQTHDLNEIKKFRRK